uniref:Histone domain-containing protein n=1 Tax=Strongyloides papillosus TaxID=174720 RepID=A0A0N5C938_STREA
MGKFKFTARPKGEYKLYGETYASATTIRTWYSLGGNQENNQNVANGFVAPRQPAIQAPQDSGPIIEEVNSDEEMSMVEKLSTTMNNTTITDDFNIEPTEEEPYTILDLDDNPRCSTAKRDRGLRNFDRDFFYGGPDVSAICGEGSVSSQLWTSGNKGVVHFEDVPSSGNGRGSKRNCPTSREVTFITPIRPSDRRYTPPLENKHQGSNNLRRNKSRSAGNINDPDLMESPESEDLDYSDEEDDDFSEADDVEVAYSEDDSSDLDDNELESVREGVRKFHKNAIAKNVKFIDKLRKEGKNAQGINRFSSSSALQIPRAPFHRLVKEIYQDITKQHCRLGKDVIDILQCVSEEYMIDCFKMANVVTAARQKVTLYPRDLRAARKITSMAGP